MMELGPRQQALVDALKSGKYTQGKFFLRDLYDRFCCLGVACELCGLASWAQGTNCYSYTDRMASMPEFVRLYFGFRSRSGAGRNALDFSISTYNDTLGYSFNAIAEMIEADPGKFFVHSK